MATELVMGLAWNPAVTIGVARLDMNACSSWAVLTLNGSLSRFHSISTVSSFILAKEAYHFFSLNMVCVDTSCTLLAGSKHGLHSTLSQGHSSSSAFALTIEFTLLSSRSKVSFGYTRYRRNSWVHCGRNSHMGTSGKDNNTPYNESNIYICT